MELAGADGEPLHSDDGWLVEIREARHAFMEAVR
jgi:hypothetical protein